MPSPRSAPAPVPAAPSSKGLIVLLYSHQDPIQKGLLISYLRTAARNTNHDLWWDPYMGQPDFNHEILSRLERADLVVCALSQNFFSSDYIANVEAPALRRRWQKRAVKIVPVKYRRYLPDKRFAWMSDTHIHHVPMRVKSIRGAKNQDALYEEVGRYVETCILGQPAPPITSASPVPPATLYSMRRKQTERLTVAEKAQLQNDARERARHFIRSPELRRQICDKARAWGASLKTPLGKEKLARLDELFLMHQEGRRFPDPKKVRFVLRAAGLHPQTRAGKSGSAA
jgi:hypothetical protein